MKNTITINEKTYTITGKPEDMPAALFYRAMHIAQSAKAVEGDEAKSKDFYQGMFFDIMAAAEEMVYFALGKDQADEMKRTTTVAEFRDAAFEVMSAFPNLVL